MLNVSVISTSVSKHLNCANNSKGIIQSNLTSYSQAVYDLSEFIGWVNFNDWPLVCGSFVIFLLPIFELC